MVEQHSPKKKHGIYKFSFRQPWHRVGFRFYRHHGGKKKRCNNNSGYRTAKPLFLTPSAAWSHSHTTARHHCLPSTACHKTPKLPNGATLKWICYTPALPVSYCGGRPRLKCDGTRAETRFRLSAKCTSPFKSAGASVQSTTGSRGVRISGSNAGYIMFRGTAKSTGYPLHSPVSPSIPLPCFAACHHISIGIYPTCRRWGVIPAASRTCKASQ
jgi:hypothetical protein